MPDNFERPTNETYYTLFQRDARGQAVLAELAALFYDGNQFDTDPYKHAFNAGKREVIRYLLTRCRVLPPTEDTE